MTSLSQTQKDRIRQSHINSPRFDPAWLATDEGGPMFIVLSCGHTNGNYRDGLELKNGKTGYDNINWE